MLGSLMAAATLAALAYSGCEEKVGPHIGAGGAIPPPEPECRTAFVGRVGETEIRMFGEGDAIIFTAGMAIDADGAPDAYHPDDIGSDYLANAGRPGNWWALATDNGRRWGEPLRQTKDDPNPGYYISTTALADVNRPANDPGRYVDSNEVPYVVLPGGFERGMGLGDLALVVNLANGRAAYAIYADIGPRDKIGEGSVALARALGIASDPKAGGTEAGVAYILFPGSGQGSPLGVDDIRVLGSEALGRIGGAEAAAACIQ